MGGSFEVASRVSLTSLVLVTIMVGSVAGWSSLAARRAHNPKVAGSNPAPATNEIKGSADRLGLFYILHNHGAVMENLADGYGEFGSD